MFDKAFQFLKEHKEVAFATSEGNFPKLRIFQIMKQEGHVLYFATSVQKAVYRELRQNPYIRQMLRHGELQCRRRCETMDIRPQSRAAPPLYKL